ncbi:family 43 glycosylhydrolase [Phytoactinopolyspora halotolerans]|uniref:Family 43 glycosylhydrolase n=1 Tax=Phytoactinopolyspora halotolerans TaxID=1981512 RepID=A0A6L9SIV6_9ACTN|nr:family 43 glycosylhydrolase [Phytoactinopolyspora halotolerans]NEE04342.1 family 43 glycosylhydrolase [Phytoactinopolyspora halotolerans]
MTLLTTTMAGPRPRWRAGKAAVLLTAVMVPAAFLPQTATADEPSSEPAVSAEQAGEPRGQIPLTGSVGVHDPTLFADDDAYYVAATNGSIRSAPRLEGPWTNLGNVPRADWTSSLPGLSGGLWAPHVQRIEDTFYFYYATSAFGTNNSAVGLKTTRNPADPSSYVDHGAPVVASGAADPEHATHNAIDPAIWPDENGDWWLVWGSHFDGIMIQRLGEDMASVVGERHLIAHRASEAFPIEEPGCPYPEPACPNFNRIEGPSIFERDGYFYLMVAWDWCCRPNGNDNTYKIVIGRSENIFGPYVDKNGVDLAEGGGSIILNSREAAPEVTPAGLYRAPGGPDVFVEDDTYYLVYHAYRPQSTLGIRPMNWHDGWPYFDEPGGGPYDLDDRAYYRLVNQDGIITDPDSLQNPEASDRCLTATAEDGGFDVVQAVCDDESLEQIWELQREPDGFWRLRSMIDPSGHCLATADGSGAIGTEVVAVPCAGDDDAPDAPDDAPQGPGAAHVDGASQLWYLDDTGHGFHRPVAKDVNLALEVENDDGVVGTDVIGGYRRDGDHRPGNLTQAAKWPPQQWRLSMEPIDIALLLAAFDGFVEDGRIQGHSPGRADVVDRRVSAVRTMLVEAGDLIETGNHADARAALSDAQKRIHADGAVQPFHFVTGDEAGTLHGLIEELKESVDAPM